jgi:hypothetical protein
LIELLTKRQQVLHVGLWLALIGASLCAHPRADIARADFGLSFFVALAISAAASYSQFRLSTHAANVRNKKNPVDKGRNNDIRFSAPGFNEPIVILKGKGRMGGVIMDGTDITVTTTTTQGASHKKVSAPSTVQYTYRIRMAMILCKGPVSRVVRLWLGDRLIYNADATGAGGGGDDGGGGSGGGKGGGGSDVNGVIDAGATYPTNPDNPAGFYNAAVTLNPYGCGAQFDGGFWSVYYGTADQPQDPTLVAIHGAANTPAYRGRCYLVLDINVTDGQVPNVTIELDEGTSAAQTVVADLYKQTELVSGDLDMAALSGDTLDGVMISQREPLQRTLDSVREWLQVDFPEVDGKIKAVKRNGTSGATLNLQDIRAHDPQGEPPQVDCVVKDGAAQPLPNRIEVGYLDETPGQDFHQNLALAQRATGNSQDLTNLNFNIVATPTQAKRVAEVINDRAHVENRSFTDLFTGWAWRKLHPGDVVTLVLNSTTHVLRIIKQQYGLPTGQQKLEGVLQSASLFINSMSGYGGSGTEPPVVQFAGNQKLVLFECPPLRTNQATGLYLYAASCLRGDGTWRGAFLYEADPAGTYGFVTSFAEQSTIGVTASALGYVQPHLFDATSTLLLDMTAGALTSHTQAELLADPFLNLLAVKNAGGDVELVQFTTATVATTAFTANAATDVCTATAHNFSNGWALQLTSSGTLPAPLVAGTTYYVINATANTFKLAATSGGAAINLTTAGTGTHSAALYWPYVRRYQVSGFLRGRFGTESASSTHAANCDVVLFDATLQAIQLQEIDLGRAALNFKSVSSGQQVADAAVVSITPVGRSTRPLPPVQVMGTRNAASDVLIQLTPRTAIGRLRRNITGTPKLGDQQRYDIEIFNGATLLRTLRVKPGVSTLPFWSDAGASNSQIGGDTALVTIDANGGAVATAGANNAWLLSAQVIHGTGAVELTVPTALALAAGLALVPYTVYTDEPHVGGSSPGWTTNLGTTKASDSGGATTVSVAAGDRLRIEIRERVAYFYKNYTGPDSVPVRASHSELPAASYRVGVRFGGVAGALDTPRITTDQPETVYTAAQQAQDGLTPGAALSVRVYEVDAIFGRSDGADFTL